MTFEVETGGRKRIVAVSGGHGKYNAVLDGKVLALDAARVGALWSLIVVDGAGSGSPEARGVTAGRSYEVTFDQENGDEIVAYVNRRAIAVSLNAPAADGGRRRLAQRQRDGATAGIEVRHGALMITAPMPGRIVKVLVNAGDRVAARQGLVVVEAMKMENEVRSPRAGTVKEVRVTQGTLVEARTVLVVIE